MKFSAALTSLLFVLPLLVADVDAAATRRKGGNGKNKKGGNNANATAAANTTAVANATATAAANSTAVLAANNNTANNNNNDPQTSLTLDPKVIATGFEQDGQNKSAPVAGQVPSLTSSNNFINFCLTVPNLPITNGQQIKTGSCNPAPLGIIAAQTNMPSAKFTFPTNGVDIGVNTPFTITMAINHLETGNFVNAQQNYYAAPQQVNGAGDIIGHSHFTVQLLSSLTSSALLDPQKFAFFKGVNAPAANGVLSESVAKGLPAGAYRLCSMNTDANHTPALVAVAQHGSLDDCVYFTVGAGANAVNPFAGNSTGSAAAASNSTAAAGNSTATAGNSTATAAAGNATTPQAGQQGGKNNKGGKNGKQGGKNNKQPFRLRRQY